MRFRLPQRRHRGKRRPGCLVKEQRPEPRPEAGLKQFQEKCEAAFHPELRQPR